MRVLPSSMRVGDSLAVAWALPPLEASEDWQAVSLSMRHKLAKGEMENLNFARNLTIEATGTAELNLAAADTAVLADGIWLYEVVGVGDAGTTREFEAGLIDLRDNLNPVMTFDERMLAVIEGTIEAKMTGRGDVIEYTIGDREVKTMSLDELHRAREYYKMLVDRTRNGRRIWDYGYTTRG